MKRTLFAAGILSVALASVGNAQTTTDSTENGTHYTQAQMKQLAQSAHTPEQYKALASYYNVRQKTYLQKAEEEKQEWVRRSQNITVVAAKYPRPVDSARYLYEYYTSKALEAGYLTAKYEQLAGTELPAEAQ